MKRQFMPMSYYCLIIILLSFDCKTLKETNYILSNYVFSIIMTTMKLLKTITLLNNDNLPPLHFYCRVLVYLQETLPSSQTSETQSQMRHLGPKQMISNFLYSFENCFLIMVRVAEIK